MAAEDCNTSVMTCQVKFTEKRLPNLFNLAGVRFLVGIVVEVALHQDDGRALIAGAGGQVAKRADQVR